MAKEDVFESLALPEAELLPEQQPMSVEDNTPITAAVKEKPEPKPVRQKDPIREQFEKALNSPEWAELQPDQQRNYMNIVFDNSTIEEHKALDPQQRANYLDFIAQDFKAEYEHDTSVAGQIESVLGHKVSPGVEKWIDRFEKMPGSGPLLGFTKNSFKSIGAGLASIGTKAQLLLDEEMPPPEPTGNEVLDKKRMTAYEALSTRKTADFMQGAVDSFEGILLQMTRHKDLGQAIMDMAEQAPTKKDRASLDSLVQSSGIIEPLVNATGLTTNVIADSMGIMLPAMATGTSPKAMLAAMQHVHSGLQQDAAKQAGVDIDPGLQELSGFVQASLGMAAGPEAYLAGKQGSQIIESLMRSGFKRALSRVSAGMSVEAATEFTQEYINQQVPEWSDENRGFWNNLDDDQKKEVIQGAILAPFAAGPFEAVGAASKGATEAKTGKDLSEFVKKQKLKEMTPEERGAAGQVTVAPRTEADLEEVMHRHTPEFMKDDPEMTTKFVKGEQIEGLDEGQEMEVGQARLAANQEIEGPAPTKVELEDEQHQQILESIKSHTIARAEVEEARGEELYGQVLRKRADSVTFVEPTEEPEHEWARELRGFIEDRYGATVVFFDGGTTSKGMIQHEGNIAIKWRPNGQEAIAAGAALHELTHNVMKRDPVQFRALAETMAEAFPEEWDAVNEVLDQVDGNRATPMSKALRDEEHLTYFVEANAPHFFRAIADGIEQKAPSRGIKRAIEQFAQWLEQLVEKAPALRKWIPVLPKDGAARDRAIADVARSFAQALDATSEGRRPTRKVKTKPAKQPKAAAPLARDVKVGDAIAITRGIGGKVAAVREVDGQLEIELTNGETHVLSPETPLRGREAGKAPKKTKPKPKPAPAPKAPGPAPVKGKEKGEDAKKKDEKGEQQSFWSEDLYHFSTVDSGKVGISRDFAGTGAAGQERTRFEKRADGTLDPDSAAVHLYVGGKAPEAQVVGKSRYLSRIKGKLNLLDIKLKEGRDLADAVNKDGFTAEKHFPEFKKRLAAAGYDGIVDRDRGMAQVYRDIKADEIEDTKELSRKERKGFMMKKPSERTQLPKYGATVAENEAVVEEIEASGAVASMELDLKRITGDSWGGDILEGGKPIADVEIRVQFAGTEDETVFFDWIGDAFLEPGEIRPKGEVLGIRGVLALRQQLQANFPGAMWVAGLRVGGTHAISRNADHDALIRVPIHTKSQRRRNGIKLPPERSQSDLMMLYGFDAFYGRSDKEVYEDELRDSGAEVAVQEGYDEDPDVLFDQLDNDDELVEYLREQTKDDINDVFGSEELVFPDDGIRTFDSQKWNALGEQHGVANLGGMGKMQAHGGAELPGGGVDGTFTYEELLWIKAAAIDPEDAWTEEEHAQFQRKLARTFTPEKSDPLQVFNNFIFAMMSNGLNLTANEVGYSMVRAENVEQVAEWAKRVPWDATEGQVPSVETLDYMPKDELALFKHWLKEDKKLKIDKIEDAKFPLLLKQFYDFYIVNEFGIGTKGRGGLGLGQMKYHLSDVAAMAQFYQKDPDWFLIGDGESWYHYSNRIASQFRGMSFKIAIFGGVWQDPLNAAVSAIDRHMAVILREEIFTDATKRKAFEDKVLREWKKKRESSRTMELFPSRSIDEIMQAEGGTAFIGEQLLVTISKPVKRKYNLQKKDFKFLRNPEQLYLMSREYKNALKQNIRESKRLGLGVFATQHLLWDRQRRRVEPHASQFPGLYKVPKLTQPKMKQIFERLREAGHVSTKHEMVEKDGKRESRLKRPRSAPPGDLAFVSEAPSYFDRGTTRKPIINATEVEPLINLNENGGAMWVIPDESWMGWIKRKIQDKFFRVKQLQKGIEDFTGVTIRDDMDPYLHELLYHGKAAAQVEFFEQDYVEPLMRHIRKQNIDMQEFERWLHARHARERNKHLRTIWYDRRKQTLEDEIAATTSDRDYLIAQGGDPTTIGRRLARQKRKLRELENAEIPISGMTDEDADAIMEETGDKFDAAAEYFDSMMDRKLEILVEAGLVSEQQAEAVTKAYEHYVPLKGKNYEGDLEKILDEAGAGTGAGFDIRGDELGFAFGRTEGDQHTHPIISQAVTDVEEAIVRVEKNEVGKAFLALTEEFPNEAYYQVNKRVSRRVWDKETGTVKLVADALAKNAKNVLAVKKDGETFYITIKDARLASALKNIGSGNHGWPVRILAAANRLMAKINTTLNPEFMVSNFIRDLQTAMVHLNDKDAQGIAMQTLANLPKAMRGIAGSEFTMVGETAWTAAYEEFMENGGKIGFFGYNDVVSRARALQRMVRRQGPGAANWSYRKIVGLGRIVEAQNTVVENGIRLAAYKTAVDNGMSPKRAAAMARRLTVNFNKKGEVGSFINAVWLFSNASLQGTARMIDAMKSSRRVRGMASSMFIMSFLQAALARGMGGDDEEDGHSYWEKLPDWQKETNTIIMLGGGKHIKIPLPYGYNIFNVLGVQAEKMFHNAMNGTSKKEDIPAAAVEVFDAMIGAFNPLGSQRLDSSWGGLRFIVPSVAAPIADTLVNETYYGAPVQPTRSNWDKSPDSQMYFSGVSKLSKELAEWANRATGGNAYQPGKVDVSPETLDYLVSAYSGAGPRTGKRILFDGGLWLWKAGATGEMTRPEANDVAFLRRIYGEDNDHTVSAMYYDNVEEIEQAENAWENLKGEKGFDRGEWRRKHGWKRRVFDDLSKAQKAIRKADDPEEKNKIRKRFNKKYRQAWLSQF